MRSAVILAGGAGRRIGGEKALLFFRGKRLIQRSFDLLSEVTDEVVVVARDSAQAERLKELVPGAKLVWDWVFGQGPVAGLQAGMGGALGEYALAVGCDLPYLNLEVVEELFEQAEGYDGAVPVWPDGKGERLHAVYHAKRMELSCRIALESGERRISAPLRSMKINYVSVDKLKQLDPELHTFFNINTPADLALALGLSSQNRSRMKV
jgi:molybdopterin-guanine dinucleotide biosynthesis protein A